MSFVFGDTFLSLGLGRAAGALSELIFVCGLRIIAQERSCIVMFYCNVLKSDTQSGEEARLELPAGANELEPLVFNEVKELSYCMRVRACTRVTDSTDWSPNHEAQLLANNMHYRPHRHCCIRTRLYRIRLR